MKKPHSTASEREKKKSLTACQGWLWVMIIQKEVLVFFFFSGNDIFSEGSGLKMKASGLEVDNHHKDCLEG